MDTEKGILRFRCQDSISHSDSQPRKALPCETEKQESLEAEGLLTQKGCYPGGWHLLIF